MPRHADSAKLHLPEVFRRVQHEMLAQLSVGKLFEHASSAGHASEHLWLDLFDRYLPQRYRAAPAFVIDSAGHRSRQIDIAIFDNLYTSPLFPHPSGAHIPAEAVYAVFEVKATFSRQWLREAHVKAASVRALRRTSVTVPGRDRIAPPPILTGLLAATSVWTESTFAANLHNALRATPLDLGCCLAHGSFHKTDISTPENSLQFFLLSLLTRLRDQGTAPAPDWSRYLP